MTDRSAPRRQTALTLAIGTIVLGLAVHRLAPASDARDIAGDALWAAMMFWWVSVLVPHATVRIRALAAVAIAWAVEFSQRVHTPWLDAARATRLGPLVLGTGFDLRDLASYLVGVALAMVIAHRIRTR